MISVATELKSEARLTRALGDILRWYESLETVDRACFFRNVLDLSTIERPSIDTYDSKINQSQISRLHLAITLL